MARNPLLVVAKAPVSYRLLLRSAGLVEAVEKILRRLTSNRIGVLDLVGIPSVRVFIPGRRTGLVRATTLQCIDVEGGLLVVGSNWARPVHPAWSTNLQEAKAVQVSRHNNQYEAEVRAIVGLERTEAWSSILRAWPNYELAQRKIPERPFRIFFLARQPSGRVVDT
jgi:deazaflavin-dependent oxidoreductase (nitroreductase family)